jgi:hypothetical protein
MNFDLEFRPGIAQGARATYRRGEFALSYAAEPSMAPERHDVQAGHTNIALWKRATRLDAPEIIGTGSLHLAAPPRETDRVDLGIVPRYEYVESEAHLRISFGRLGAHHYRVSSCLVVGTDAKGIATLDITDLRVEE